MVYYNILGECVNYNCANESFNNGSQGKVFRIDSNPSICLKTYIDGNNSEGIFDDSSNRFTQEMFNYFKKDFNHPSFCELGELLYDDKRTVVLGYTMKYYSECILNVLDLPISYILDNFSLIYDAIDKLTNDCIRVVDLNCSNIINTDNGMVVIDYDKYFKDTGSDKDTINYINRSALVYAFRGIFLKALRSHGIDVDKNKDFMRVVNNLFTINTSPLSLKCKLRNYSKSIDLFTRNSKF